jgi:hypothetical protein
MLAPPQDGVIEPLPWVHLERASAPIEKIHSVM